MMGTEKQKSAEMSSAKASGSATTQPYTNHANSGASQTSKYGTLSSQKAFYDCFKSSSVKKQEVAERAAGTIVNTKEKEKNSEPFDKENSNIRANI